MAKILVVDDIPDNVTLLRYQLEDYGYEVVTANCGAEALDLAAAEKPDAILLDVMMPLMDGIEVCQRLKEISSLAEIPVILVTAKNDDLDIIRGLDHGAHDYVTKPFNIRVLVARVEAALRSKKAQDSAHRANARLKAINELVDERNQQLAAINQTAYEFVNNVSHDFRTPLSAIKEFAAIISEGLAGPVTDQQKEQLGIISDCVADLTSMVNDMLDISKLEAGRLTVRRTTCTISEILEHVSPALERKAAAKRVHLEISPTDQLPNVYCDAPKIGRVIVNLVVNAIKFVGVGGHVCVHAEHDEESSQVAIRVTDDGPGIEPAKLRIIFERFQQVGTNIRASTEGVGLGLNIAKELVGLNFGRLSVASQLGQGSTFSFAVPTADSLDLLNRYLNDPDSTRNRLQAVSLIGINLQAGSEEYLIAEFDETLHSAVRSSDLVLKTGSARWHIVADANENQARSLIGRIKQSWEDGSQTGLSQDMPTLNVQLQGTWNIPAERDRFISCFQGEVERICEEMETVPSHLG